MHACEVDLIMSDSLQPYGLQPANLLCACNSVEKNTGVGCHALFQGIFSRRDQTRVSRLPALTSSLPLGPTGKMLSSSLTRQIACMYYDLILSLFLGFLIFCIGHTKVFLKFHNPPLLFSIYFSSFLRKCLQTYLSKQYFFLISALVWSSDHGQQKSLKCSTWMQSQK